MSLCSIGEYTKTPCSGEIEKNSAHSPLVQIVGKKKSIHHHLKKKKDFDRLCRFLIRVRSGCQHFKTICASHEEEFLTKFQANQLVCSNPFGVHKEEKKIYKQRNYDFLRLITVKMYRGCKKCDFGVNIIPGRKLCGKCYKKCMAKINEKAGCDISSSSGDSEEDCLYNLALDCS